MLYLLAAVGAITVAVLLWRAFGVSSTPASPRSATLAPDDDPEFLRGLDKRKREGEEGPS